MAGPLVSPRASSTFAVEMPETAEDKLGGQRVVETKSFRDEVVVLARASVPVVGTNMAAYSLILGNILVVGRLGTLEVRRARPAETDRQLASVSLATMTLWIVGMMVLRALGYALDTLCTQAYGAQPKLCSTLAMRSAVLMLAVLPLQLVFAWHSESVLVALGQDADVANLAARYLLILALSLPAYGLYEVQRCWLQSQGLMHVPTMVTCCVAPCSLGLVGLLVHVRGPVLLNSHESAGPGRRSNRLHGRGLGDGPDMSVSELAALLTAQIGAWPASSSFGT